MMIAINLLLLVLLLSRKPLRQLLGAQGQYALWALVPLSGLIELLLSTVALPVTTFTTNPLLSAGNKQLAALSQHQPWLHYLWLTGAIALLVVVVAQHGYFYYHYCRNSTPNPAGPAICRHNQLASPVLIGPLWTRLILPTDFEQRFSATQQQLILAHEYKHWRRGDLYWNLLALLVLATNWFNPLFWLAYMKFRDDQELACDAAVLNGQNKATRVAYSRALIHSMAPPVTGGLILLHYHNNKENLMTRLKQLQPPVVYHRIRTLALAACGLALSVGVASAGNVTDAKVIKPLYRAEPSYPANAAKAKQTGFVKLNFDIRADGSVHNARVIASKPAGVFDQAALTALNQWHYHASPHGKKNVKVQINFAMENPAPTPGQPEQIHIAR
ncbi:TonB family protein [Gallaecimonas sp. GXIMD1310]|uniref:TonB family protein n=1 Tax=Gallaecimonas sp. GXIMD1310 TaxID=3131926 RepID=UPI0032487030